MILKLKLECKKLRPFLWDYSAVRLPEERMEQLESHLAKCSRCKAELVQYRSAQNLIKTGRGNRLPEPVLDWQGLRAVLEELPPPVQMAQQQTPKPMFRSGPLVWSAVGGTAAAALMLLVARPQTAPMHYHAIQAKPQTVAVANTPKVVKVQKLRQVVQQPVIRYVEVPSRPTFVKSTSSNTHPARQGFEDAALALIANVTPPAENAGREASNVRNHAVMPAQVVNVKTQPQSNLQDIQRRATLVSASSDGGDAHYVMSALQPDPYGGDTPY